MTVEDRSSIERALLVQPVHMTVFQNQRYILVKAEVFYILQRICLAGSNVR